MPVAAPIALAPAAIGAITSGIQAITGGSQLKKDKAELERLAPVFYKIQNEYDENRNTSAALAGQGYTQSAKDYFTDTTNRGLASSIDAINQLKGASPNAISDLFSGYSDSIRKFAAEDSEKQLQNIHYYHQANKDLAGQKTMQWVINDYQPHQNKLKELTERIAADKQNIWNGIQGGIGALQAGVTGLENNSLMKKLFANGDGSVPDPMAVNPTIKGFLSSPVPKMTMNDLTGNQPIVPNNNNISPQLVDTLQEILNQLQQTKNPNQ